MKTIPINAIPNQSLTVILDGVSCFVEIRQKSTGVYLDLSVDGNKILTGQICLDRVPVIFPDYRGFAGQLFFQDTQGNQNPSYQGFGTRYQLKYES